MTKAIETIEEAAGFLREVNAQRALGGEIELKEDQMGCTEASLTWVEPTEGFSKNVIVSYYPENGYWHIEGNASKEGDGVCLHQQRAELANKESITPQDISEACDLVASWREDDLTLKATFREGFLDNPPGLNLG